MLTRPWVEVLAVMPKERAVALVEQDPYCIHGQRGYRLLQWGKALQDMSVSPPG